MSLITLPTCTPSSAYITRTTCWITLTSELRRGRLSQKRPASEKLRGRGTHWFLALLRLNHHARTGHGVLDGVLRSTAGDGCAGLEVDVGAAGHWADGGATCAKLIHPRLWLAWMCLSSIWLSELKFFLGRRPLGLAFDEKAFILFSILLEQVCGAWLFGRFDGLAPALVAAVPALAVVVSRRFAPILPFSSRVSLPRRTMRRSSPRGNRRVSGCSGLLSGPSSTVAGHIVLLTMVFNTYGPTGGMMGAHEGVERHRESQKVV